MAICMDHLCTHRMACCKTWYWGLRIIVEKSIECYIEPKILGTLQEDESSYTCFQQYNMFSSLTAMHRKQFHIFRSDVAQQYKDDLFFLFIGSMQQHSHIET